MQSLNLHLCMRTTTLKQKAAAKSSWFFRSRYYIGLLAICVKVSKQNSDLIIVCMHCTMPCTSNSIQSWRGDLLTVISLICFVATTKTSALLNVLQIALIN